MTGLPSEADYIVVGAGTAGCIIAARLAEAGHSVALIEAGPKARDPLLSVPILTGYFLRSNRYNWHFQSEPVPALNNRRIDWPRGKVVGGSGAINGMVYARGLASDYDRWAQTGLTDWSWQRVRPVFEDLEQQPDSGEPTGHVAVDTPQWWTPLFDAFLAAAKSAGLGQTEDFNGDQPTGGGRYRFTTHRGHRANTARTFLKPALATGRLALVTDATVLGIEIVDGRATGIRLRRGDIEGKVAARAELVLAAGTVGSPHILMLSGIGPGDVLRQAGVSVRVDRPSVGQNLQDHVLVRVEHAALKPGPLWRLLRADRAALAVTRAMLFGTGPASVFPLLVGGFFKSDPAVDEPDLQAHFLPALTSATVRINPFKAPPGAGERDGFFANVARMRPDSRGHIALASADPLAAPLIFPNYLDSVADRQVLRQGVRVLRHLFAQPAFEPYRGRELAPGAEVQSDDEIDGWIAETASTQYHPVGTCRMGADPGAVVDGDLRVRGIDGLRVADASVMPTITSANTQAPTMLIAEMAARAILSETPRPEQTASDA